MQLPVAEGQCANSRFWDRQIAIGTLCAARKAKLKRTKKGTSVKVTFGKGGCSGVSGKVKLTALITDDCSTMSGKLKAPKTDAVEFVATISTCGDGVVDTGNGEGCDDSATGCDDGQGCTPTCTCVAVTSNVTRRIPQPHEFLAD